ncbi:hypothetical protein GCM10011409_02550 [Lentibacillus populi]|uniref:YrhC-like protein n=1 Tax=Lentibacillus populi TaxID=1827502 RepID=A0A9W5X3P0_9BACI|nr:YrhC family protein [Lentibacillus populi]GGB28768.1 hypothetical protein GCM10011409_02550 [Lentibacillus populi]
MDPKMIELEIKLKDYRRFIMTLLIVSIYLYMGSVMDTYIQSKGDGAILTGLSFAMTAAATLFVLKYRKLKLQLEDNKRV